MEYCRGCGEGEKARGKEQCQRGFTHESSPWIQWLCFLRVCLRKSHAAHPHSSSKHKQPSCWGRSLEGKPPIHQQPQMIRLPEVQPCHRQIYACTSRGRTSRDKATRSKRPMRFHPVPAHSNLC